MIDPRRLPRIRQAIVLTLLALMLVVAVGIWAWRSGRIGTYSSDRSVRGILVDVQAVSIVFAESVTLRSDDGVIHEFRVDPEVATNREEPQSASHLRQHMVLGESVIVRYRETSGGPVAIRIVDAER
jgi:hypothetical protein